MVEHIPQISSEDQARDFVTMYAIAEGGWTLSPCNAMYIGRKALEGTVRDYLISLRGQLPRPTKDRRMLRTCGDIPNDGLLRLASPAQAAYSSRLGDTIDLKDIGIQLSDTDPTQWAVVVPQNERQYPVYLMRMWQPRPGGTTDGFYAISHRDDVTGGYQAPSFFVFRDGLRRIDHMSESLVNALSFELRLGMDAIRGAFSNEDIGRAMDGFLNRQASYVLDRR